MTVRKVKPATATDSPDASGIMQLASSKDLDGIRIRRLIERCGQAGHGAYPTPLGKLKWGLQYLLRFSPGNALDILESDDPIKVVDRLFFISRVNDPHYAFMTLDELGSITSRFIDFIEGQRTSLIETGYPRTRFETSSWHDWRMTDLYRTKIPQSVILSVQQQKQVSGGPRIQERGILEYTWSPTATSHPFPPDLWIGSLFALNMTGEYRATAYGPPPQDRCVPAEPAVPYAEAPYMRGFTLNQANFMEMGRQYVLNAKILILQELCRSLSSNDPDALWDQCFVILREALPQRDIRSFMFLDHPDFLDVYGKQFADGAKPVGSITGGLNSLFSVIWHFESELRVGPMRKVREILGDAVVLQPDGARAFRKTAGWLSDADLRRIDEAMAMAERLDKEKYLHEDDFGQRLRQDIEKRAYATVMAEAKVPAGKKGDLQAVMDSYARHVEASTRAGIPVSAGGLQKGLEETATDGYVFRRDGDFWRLSYEGKSMAVKHSLGMEYLWHLLLSPKQHIGVFTLSHLISGDAADVRSEKEVDPDKGFDDGKAHDTRIMNPGDGILQEANPENARLIMQRLRQIKNDIEGAIKRNDREVIRSLQKEKRLLWDAYNDERARPERSGRAEALDNDLEKLRKAVWKCIATSIESIRKHHRAMGVHLYNSIRKGKTCVYQPDREIEWSLL